MRSDNMVKITRRCPPIAKISVSERKWGSSNPKEVAKVFKIAGWYIMVEVIKAESD